MFKSFVMVLTKAYTLVIRSVIKQNKRTLENAKASTQCTLVPMNMLLRQSYLLYNCCIIVGYYTTTFTMCF